MITSIRCSAVLKARSGGTISPLIKIFEKRISFFLGKKASFLHSFICKRMKFLRLIENPFFPSSLVSQISEAEQGLKIPKNCCSDWYCYNLNSKSQLFVSVMIHVLYFPLHEKRALFDIPSDIIGLSVRKRDFNLIFIL